MDQYFFTEENFYHLKEVLADEIDKRFHFKLGDELDNNIKDVMKYILRTHKSRSSDVKKVLFEMNEKVLNILFTKFSEKLEGDPSKLMEQRRKERSTEVAPIDNFEVAGVEDQVQMIHAHQSNDILNTIEMQMDSDSDEQLPINHPVQESSQNVKRSEEAQYLILDSRFRDFGKFPNASQFSIDLPQTLQVSSIECVDLVINQDSKLPPYLLLEIEEIRGRYMGGGNIFTKLIQNNPICYRPSVHESVRFAFPQAINTLSFKLMNPNYNLLPADTVQIEKIEQSRSGNVQLILKHPMSFASGNVACKQFLLPDEVQITLDSFKDNDIGTWVYGNFSGVAAKAGDYLHIKTSTGDLYKQVINGTDNSALQVELLTEDVKNDVQRLSLIVSSSENVTKKGLFNGDFRPIVKTWSEKERGVDKIEIEYPFESISEKEHLGTKLLVFESLQLSYTFKLTVV